jgi:hypothetical protein
MEHTEQEASPSPSSPPSIILESLLFIFYAIRGIHWSWYMSWLLRIIVWPIKMVLLPVSFAARIALVLLSPARYILSCFSSCVANVVDLIISAEPLYTFFGSAAVIGIIAGLFLAVSSKAITSYLGLDEDEPLKAKELDIDVQSILEESSSNETELEWHSHSPTRRRLVSGLASQTIHEEDDSE